MKGLSFSLIWKCASARKQELSLSSAIIILETLNAKNSQRILYKNLKEIYPINKLN